MSLTWLNKVEKTPCYVIDEAKIIRNLEVLRDLEQTANCKVLLAQKAFSMYALYSLIGKYISGTTASGLYEARLGFEEMGKETHVYSPAYTENDMSELVKICDHIVFNSFNQWEKHKSALPASISAGLRINPEFSTQEKAIYDPCAKFSRFGITIEETRKKDFSSGAFSKIEGLHFHTLCEQNSDALEATLNAVEEKFGYLFPRLKWLNFGGGHHITRSDYDIKTLCNCVKKARSYNLEVYLEPGEAFALNAGYLITEVLDIVYNGMEIAILDASAACHAPDIIEAPYRAPLIGGGKIGEKRYNYRLCGNTCLAGDIIGDYSFDEPLKAGDRLIFEDMAIYTMVKTNTFNGTPLPNIALLKTNGDVEIVKRFGYEEFKGRV